MIVPPNLDSCAISLRWFYGEADVNKIEISEVQQLSVTVETDAEG